MATHNERGTTAEAEMDRRSADYERIEGEIASDASPVGIDARKTHVMILMKLEDLDRRLERLERGMLTERPPTDVG
jgi:hypothetical protein